MQVALPDDGVGPRRVRIEVGRLGAGLGSGARVHDRVACAEPLAVLDEVVIGGEGEVAVVGAPEELHAVEQDAVDLLVVEGVLLRPAHEEVAPDEAVGAVHTQDDVLGVAAGLRRRPRALIVGARVEDHVLGLRAGALDLQVAPHARAELLSRDALAVRERRLWRVTDHRAPLHVDQVLVVGAGDLVLVARGEVAAGVLLEQAGVAGRVILRGRYASPARYRGRAGSKPGRCCPRRGSPAEPSGSRTAPPARR